MVIWVAGTMFKDLGHSDSEITLSTASVGVMWSLKPLYAGFLDMLKTKKFWVLTMEFALAALLGCVALSLALPNYFTVIILFLWLIAFASARHPDRDLDLVRLQRGRRHPLGLQPRGVLEVRRAAPVDRPGWRDLELFGHERLAPRSRLQELGGA